MANTTELNIQNVPFQRKKDNYQPNLFTESRQEFSENEKKIVSLVINQLRKDVIIDWTGHNLEFLIPLTELTDANHDRIKKSVFSLASKKIIQDFGNDSKDGIIYRVIVPFPVVEYCKIKNNSFIRVKMISDVVPYFIELGKQYTKYSLDIILSLGSIYSQRLYEIIMLHLSRNQRSFKYSVDKIKFMLNCPDNYTFNEIRRWALMPSMKELEEKSGIIFSFIPSKKEGKKVIELEFNVKSRIEVALEGVFSEAENFKSASSLEKRDYTIRLLNNYKFTRKQQDDILTDPIKWAIFMQIDSEIFNGVRNVENPTAYIAKSLGFDKPKKNT